ncbi:DNA mismatch repair protein MutS [Halogeometricum borinquense DSM 11551]|uniref:DNA mismatch repair protein MutS n=1 Tax=Halogeometricum borinquense (strain ATCC 700274 / DSM 11551 / JCM 10706 / KCTC 4070 / PR3) TaxID=469382 RepID=E4NTB3_HALBP|nr:DNA mismatch repair protein MutS [Halogeometricum borinquense]ADQ68210.1 DNA mismatch repair protein MutS [Halogeometricum borinquense DSM 11551]ELY24746.1 DNA mismatch repair protein MutS [Halogeometricum borinquense DSM 11551]
MTSQGIVGEFLSLKSETDADVLTMQCGDFYEFFGDDAEFVAEELDLKVSQKSSHGSSYPMAGVPVDDLTPYLKVLVERGYRVAVADQFDGEDGHYRKITRVATPGTLLETTDADARYIASMVAPDDDEGVGLAFADVTTGQFFVTETDDADAAYSELYRFSPVEILPGPTVRGDDDFLSRLRQDTDASLSLFEADAFAPGRAKHVVRDQFGRETLESVGLNSDLAVRAAGAVLRYVEETGTGVLQSMTRLQTYETRDHLELDATTQRNLELTETMHGETDGTLVDAIDHTVTSPGGRLLREWLTRPRRDRAELERRLDAVTALAREALSRERVRDTLDGVYDLERLAARAASGSAGASDLLSVRDTLAVLPAVAEAIEESPLSESPLSDVVARPDREAAAALHDELADALADDPPKTVRQGGLFKHGYDDELDELIDSHEEAQRWIDTLADREKRQHSLSHVTVDRNKTDGYYIQVGKSVADQVPEHYREIKTLKNSKRFVTEELEEREREILRLEESRGELEYELFCELRERVAAHAELLQDVGRVLAEIDVLSSLATHAAGNDWTRPTLTDPGPVRIEAGRHPVVERTTEFVPNDLYMDDERGFLIVTGPNMSGKSTYMRQAALIVLLAQVGSFVPARSAEIGVVDGIYTRVGALDELAQGRSTFMVEMQELSNILHSATEDSLVILDEVGRGTATYDGISIAWAATEYLHNEVRAKTLFATHYHELTSLADHLDRVANVHVAAEERDGDVTFLRTVQDGPTDRSYGIHVADLAGVPKPVVSRADNVLEKLREEKAIEAKGGESDKPVQAVFDLSSGEFSSGESSGQAGSGQTTDGQIVDGQTADGQAASADQRESGVAAAQQSQHAANGESTAGRDASRATDPEADEILDELRETDVNSNAPLDIMAKVQEWQRRLSDND